MRLVYTNCFSNDHVIGLPGVYHSHAREAGVIVVSLHPVWVSHQDLTLDIAHGDGGRVSLEAGGDRDDPGEGGRGRKGRREGGRGWRGRGRERGRGRKREGGRERGREREEMLTRQLNTTSIGNLSHTENYYAIKREGERERGRALHVTHLPTL